VGTVALPPDFWIRPEITGALDRRDISHLLTMVLAETRLSQDALGAATGVSQTQINHWKNSKHRPVLDSIRKIADACAMPASARTRLGLSVSAANILEDRPSQMRLYRILALAEYIGRTGDISQLSAWRELIQADGNTEAWDWLEQVIIAAHDSKPTTAAANMAFRTRGFYLVTAKLPAQLVTLALTIHARDVALLLDAAENPDQRRRLTVTGGESAYLAACCNVDLGDYCGAMRQLDTMEAAAKQASDGPLAAMALDGRSHFQAAQRHHARALDLVQQARDGCSAEESPGTVAYTWLRIAEEHVYLRQCGKAAEAWLHAEDNYAATDIAADRNWIGMWLGKDCWESVRAVIYSAIGKPKQAAEAAERVAARLAGAEGKTDAIALVNAALAQANTGLFRPAAATGIQALRAIRAAEAGVCLARLSIVADILGSQVDRVPQVQPFLQDFTRTQQQLDTQSAATQLVLQPEGDRCDCLLRFVAGLRLTCRAMQWLSGGFILALAAGSSASNHRSVVGVLCHFACILRKER
jgi:transcriptional regulator with XRE-family HTH domain